MKRILTGLLAIAATVSIPSFASAEPAPVGPSSSADVTIQSASPTATRAVASGVCQGRSAAAIHGGGFAWVPALHNDGVRDCWLEYNTSYYNLATRTLQYALQRANGYPNLSIDGYYGTGTRAAVRDFQKRNGLAIDGVYGIKTGSRMLWYNGHAGRWY